MKVDCVSTAQDLYNMIELKKIYVLTTHTTIHCKFRFWINIPLMLIFFRTPTL